MFWITWGGFFLKYCECKASGGNFDRFSLKYISAVGGSDSRCSDLNRPDATSVFYVPNFIPKPPYSPKLVFVLVQCLKERFCVNCFVDTWRETVMDFVCVRPVNVSDCLSRPVSDVTVLLNALVGLKLMQTCVVDRKTINISNQSYMLQ